MLSAISVAPPSPLSTTLLRSTARLRPTVILSIVNEARVRALFDLRRHGEAEGFVTTALGTVVVAIVVAVAVAAAAGSSAATEIVASFPSAMFAAASCCARCFARPRRPPRLPRRRRD